VKVEPRLSVSGAKLKAARTAAGLTRPELSALTGIPIETIRTAELRPHSPRAETVALIAHACGVPMESLFDTGEAA
jgi:transcriptional regulator with XRE-family HTH domain